MSFHKGPAKSSPAEKGIRPYGGAISPMAEKIDGVEFQQVMDGNLLPSGMTTQAMGQQPQEALPEAGGGKFSAAQNGFPHAPDAEGRKAPMASLTAAMGACLHALPE